MSQAVTKGMISAALSLGVTTAVDQLLITSGDLTWALYAVASAGFFSGFFSEITGKFCIGFGDTSYEEFVVLGTTFTVIGVTNDGTFSHTFLLGSVIFWALAAWNSTDKTLGKLKS